MIDLPVVFDRRPWGLVAVEGPDATSFLQAVVSQDLAPVEVGATVSSLLLHPQGKLDVVFRATRRPVADVAGSVDGADGGADEADGAADGGAWWLDTDPASAARLAASLARYRIRVKAEIDDRTGATALASVVGATLDDARAAEAAAAGLVVVGTRWGEHEGVDVLGSGEAVRAWIDGAALREGTPEELEVLRIAAGIPAPGVDVDESTIPQEAFLEVEGVSFTKGCFIGQELVCRIDTRGHVNRFLRRLSLAGTTVPGAGAEVRTSERVVGQVTSATKVPGEDRVVALAMLRREVEPPAEVLVAVADADAPIPATVLPTPS